MHGTIELEAKGGSSIKKEMEISLQVGEPVGALYSALLEVILLAEAESLAK